MISTILYDISGEATGSRQMAPRQRRGYLQVQAVDRGYIGKRKHRDMIDENLDLLLFFTLENTH